MGELISDQCRRISAAEACMYYPSKCQTALPVEKAAALFFLFIVGKQRDQGSML
jgi:hypothetical protein